MAAIHTEPLPLDASERSRWFRGDIDGLRAIAIVLVVGYHVGLPFFGGGFIGVDVFFVISGFLISRNLLREAESSARIGLAGFWARRVRRLVPALALVVIATLIIGTFVIARFELASVARQGASASLYVSNVLFAGDAQDYFAADLSSSPFLHTWSLGVEEQFYLVWPLLFGAVCWSQRRRLAGAARQRRRSVLVAVFAGTFALSMATNLMLTSSGSSWAFFGLPSRAWEFAAAGLLAAVPVPDALRSVSARTALAIGGFVVLALGLKTIDDRTVYPGMWALLPVLATTMIILSGERFAGDAPATVASRGLALAPMQWLGRVSYSWYLWHWPAIVLAVVWAGDDSTKVKAIAAAVTLPIAWAAYQFFETPLRFAPVIASSNRRTFVFGVSATAATLLVAAAVWSSAPRLTDDDLLAQRTPSDASLQDRVALAMQAYETRDDISCPPGGARTSSAGDEYCVGGDPDGARTLMLIGDSHAGQWHHGLDEVAAEKGLRLVVRQHLGCPAIPVLYDQVSDSTSRTFEYCGPFEAGDLRLLDEIAPDAVIVSQWSGTLDRIVDASGNQPDSEGRAQLWESGMRSLLDSLDQRGIEVGWIFDVPTLPLNASECLDEKDDVAVCEPVRADTYGRSGRQLEIEHRVLGERDDIATLDMADVVCDVDRCRLEIDGVLTYVDHHHLTGAFAAVQTPKLGNLVDRMIG